MSGLNPCLWHVVKIGKATRCSPHQHAKIAISLIGMAHCRQQDTRLRNIARVLQTIDIVHACIGTTSSLLLFLTRIQASSLHEKLIWVMQECASPLQTGALRSRVHRACPATSAAAAAPAGPAGSPQLPQPWASAVQHPAHVPHRHFANVFVKLHSVITLHSLADIRGCNLNSICLHALVHSAAPLAKLGLPSLLRSC